jgi:aminoglycoside phosphotransferase (APT) family kinase protein
VEDSRLDFDAAVLEAFLGRELGEGQSASLKLERVAGGQSNPTFFVTLGSRRMVMRKKPPGQLLPSAHAVDREHRVLSALGPTGFPVPQALLYCDDSTIVGTPFYLSHGTSPRPGFPRRVLARRTFRRADRDVFRGR